MNKPNGNARVILALLSIVIIVGGWGITWGALRSQVATQKECLVELKEKKLDVDVYRADLRRIEDKLDRIIRKMENK